MTNNNIYINGKFLSQKITGVQRFADELTVLLMKEFKNYRLIVPSELKLDSFRYPEKKLIRIGNSKNINLWEQFILPNFLKKQTNPLLLCMSGLGPVFYKNKIITIHDLSFWEHPEWFSRKYFIWYRILTPFSAKNSLRILTVSNYSKQIIIDKLKKSSNEIDVVYNAVDKCNCSTENINRKKYILTVGSIDPRKNLKTLITAFQEWNNSKYQLIIIGGIQNSFSKLNLPLTDNIKLLGYVSEDILHKYYRESEIFVYPSIYEGFGIPPLEAMAHGTPVIASNTTSLPESCGKAAYYIDPFSKKDIIQALDKLSKDKSLQEKLIYKGFENINRFSWSQSAKQIHSIISSI